MRYHFREDNNFTDDMPFGEYIRKKRRLMGYTQHDFGKFFGVDQGTISQWELGETSPPIEKARQIVERLGGQILIVNRKGNADEQDNKGNINTSDRNAYGKIRSRSVQRAQGDLVQLEHDKRGVAY